MIKLQEIIRHEERILKSKYSNYNFKFEKFDHVIEIGHTRNHCISSWIPIC